MQLSYNGTPFLGWQIQPTGATVQGVLENAFTMLLREPIAITGCGRTDTGVHAKQFFAHFETEQDINTQTLTDKLNNFLPKEIAIHSIYAVENDRHARFSATSRTYKYYVAIQKNVFDFPLSYRVYQKLDIEKMNQAAQLLLTTTDFTSFSKLHTQVNNNICHVTEAQWKMENEQLVFTITADRFLRNMVRAIVGTLLLAGKGQLSINDFQNVINQKDRCKAGMSAPAHALFLEKVRY